MSGTKSTRFFWSDWESDESLRLCSLAAQGLWMRMLCICVKADGYLVIANRSLSTNDLAKVIGRPEGELKPLLEELSANGVYSVDRNGRIYSRRILRDMKLTAKGRQNAKRGWEQRRNSDKYGDNQASDKSEKNSQPNGQANEQANGDPNAKRHGPPTGRSGVPFPSSSPIPDSSRTDGMVEKLVKAAAGNVLRGTVGIEIVKPILDLEAQGCDFDTDILPAIEATVPKLGEPLRTWGAGFLRDAILAKKESRLRAANGSGHEPAKSKEELWRRQWDWWKRTREWPGVWGPSPDASHGCEIPKELIEQWSAE